MYSLEIISLKTCGKRASRPLRPVSRIDSSVENTEREEATGTQIWPTNDNRGSDGSETLSVTLNDECMWECENF